MCTPKVKTTHHVQRSQKFAELEEHHGTHYAFHGTQLENMFSIMRNGLTTQFAKSTSLFGTGIYLSCVIDVATTFFSLGESHRMSSKKFGCVAGCEVIQHPTVKYVGTPNSKASSTSRAPPNNYLVVSNNEHVRVKHVLVFEGESREVKREKMPGSVKVILLWCFLLLFIGFIRSPSWKKLLWKNLEFIF
jgi:hypothetical protein